MKDRVLLCGAPRAGWLNSKGNIPGGQAKGVTTTRRTWY